MVRRSSRIQLHPGFCYKPPHSSHGLCMKCSEVFDSMSSQVLDTSFKIYCKGPSLTDIHEGRYEECHDQLIFRRKKDIFIPPFDLHFRYSCCLFGNCSVVDPSLAILEVLQ